VTEIPIKGDFPNKGAGTCQAALAADSQEGGGIKMIPGVGSKRSQGSDHNDPLSKVSLNTVKDQVERYSISISEDGADAPPEIENGTEIAALHQGEPKRPVTSSPLSSGKLPATQPAARGG
jgi:hypothetical protein